ncbi:ALP1-like protein isoform X1 [Tanacetum coccineum]
MMRSFNPTINRYMRDYESYQHYVGLCEQKAGGSSDGPKRMRTYIYREREEAEQRLIDDYFGDDEYEPKYLEEKFRRRYRMSYRLFNKILNDILSYDVQPLPEYFSYFRSRLDATGRNSIGSILKCTSAIRQMAYGTSPNAFDEYLQIAKFTSRECLDHFTKCIHVLYYDKFLRRPTATDIQKTYELHEEKHGLLRMLESIDCMHWDWKNCPKSLHGQFKRSTNKYPTLMLEVVADKKLWIWHAYFGVHWANNDLNALYSSPLFDAEIADIAPQCLFVVNGHTYRKVYYLADGIYPAWSTFVKTFSVARDEKNLKFKRVQEAARKDIERAFGVLQDMGFRFQNSPQSKIDQTSKISKSVFISNFPDDCSSRDIWKVCNGYGTVVDVFIPNKRSKAGKRFAFVRFINVLNLDRLIENLKTIWIGRFHLSANLARFESPKASTFQKEKPVPSGNVMGFKQSIVQNQGGPKE